jgi:hypothetical protein
MQKKTILSIAILFRRKAAVNLWNLLACNPSKVFLQKDATKEKGAHVYCNAATFYQKNEVLFP